MQVILKSGKPFLQFQTNLMSKFSMLRAPPKLNVRCHDYRKAIQFRYIFATNKTDLQAKTSLFQSLQNEKGKFTPTRPTELEIDLGWI